MQNLPFFLNNLYLILDQYFLIITFSFIFISKYFYYNILNKNILPLIYFKLFNFYLGKFNF